MGGFFRTGYNLGWPFLAFGIATAIRRLSNRLNAARRRRLTTLWPEDAGPVEVKIEVYGLGRFTGRHCDKNNLTIPLDILEMLSDRYGIKTEELVKVYAKGVSDAMTQK